MKVRSITVCGFKNLKRTQLLLDGIVSIISPNNYGKSNLLEAINFGIDFISAGAKKRTQMMAWEKGIPINKALANENFSFEIEFQDESLQEYRFVKFGFSFVWYKDNQSGQRIVDEWLETRPSESVRYTSFIKRNELKYRKSKDTSAFRKVSVGDNQLIIDYLSVLDDIAIKPVVDAIKQLEYRVCSSLDLDVRFQLPPIEYIGNDKDGEISFDDEDVPRALYKLKKTNPNKYDLFQEAVFALFPEFTEIDVQSFELKKEFAENDNVETAPDGSITLTDQEGIKNTIPFKIRNELYRLFITSQYLNQPIDMSMMSTGTKRVFWLLANVFIASARQISCVGIEELETSIHPRLLKSLLEILDEVLDNTSLIISSHSPFLVQYIKPEKIYVGVPSNEGLAYFKNIKASQIKKLVTIARDNGMSVGEYLFALLTGDTDSSEMLSFYLED